MIVLAIASAVLVQIFATAGAAIFVRLSLPNFSTEVRIALAGLLGVAAIVVMPAIFMVLDSGPGMQQIFLFLGIYALFATLFVSLPVSAILTHRMQRPLP